MCPSLLIGKRLSAGEVSVSYEEEDTCVSYEEKRLSAGERGIQQRQRRRIHVSERRRIHVI